jgi:hypothetical protein
LPALRLVEMQLKPAPRQGGDGDGGWGSTATAGSAPDAAAPGRLAEYQARRCAVCGGRYPSFGFGPPLTLNGGTLWACAAHRLEIEQVDQRVIRSRRPCLAPRRATPLGRVARPAPVSARRPIPERRASSVRTAPAKPPCSEAATHSTKIRAQQKSNGKGGEQERLPLTPAPPQGIGLRPRTNARPCPAAREAAGGRVFASMKGDQHERAYQTC